MLILMAISLISPGHPLSWGSGSTPVFIETMQCAVFLNITIINDEALSGSARFVLQLR